MVAESALQHSRRTLLRVSPDSPDEAFRMAADTLAAKEQVIATYGRMFAPENTDALSAEDFRSFLLFRNNRHWDGLHRHAAEMTADMPLLREAIKLLVDESIPIRERLDQLRPHNQEGMVKWLGRAVLTAIWQVVYPERYGVLNNTSEAGMQTVGLWPEFPRGATLGERYERINGCLIETAAALGIDLWTLDALWWRVGDVEELDETVTPPATPSAFGLERYLHEFLVDNWERLDLGREWNLWEEDGEVVGSHYRTGEVGEIDILAKHKTQNKWLVIELKRDQSSDATVGQILRYMGWVRRRLASDGEMVEGLIICAQPDLRMEYALYGQPNIRCMTY